jgi:hypothetical protein
MKFFFTLSATSIFLCLITIPSWSEVKETSNAKALFETKCSVCHSIDRPKSAKKALEAWTKTVTRMKGKKDGIISNDDAKIIIDYLALNYGK